MKIMMLCQIRRLQSRIYNFPCIWRLRKINQNLLTFFENWPYKISRLRCLVLLQMPINYAHQLNEYLQSEGICINLMQFCLHLIEVNIYWLVCCIHLYKSNLSKIKTLSQKIIILIIKFARFTLLNKNDCSILTLKQAFIIH